MNLSLPKRLTTRINKHFSTRINKRLTTRILQKWFIYRYNMIEFLSLRFDRSHTLCSLCQTDCFQNTFFLKECGHSFCMNCVSVYFDGIKKEPSIGCPSCISREQVASVSKEGLLHTVPHEPQPCHREEASLLR